MKPITDEKKIDNILSKGVKEIFPDKEKLKEKLMSGDRISLYTGIDPTANFIHLGHLIWMKKLAQFQELGHHVIFLIGGFTAMIGDPDKKYTREPLTKEQVQANFESYKPQAGKILDFESKNNPIEILNNYDWLHKLNLENWLNISSQVTLQHLLSHDMFRNRLENQKPIRLHEIMYPLLQGYDGNHMKVDLEVGGSDQTFNMLTGRILSRNLSGIEKSVMTLKLLTDNSGKKMGKTTNNAISFRDDANSVYAKVMRFSDEVLPLAFELLSTLDIHQLEEKYREIELEPMKCKKELAQELTSLIHSEEDGLKAAENFSSVVQSSGIPSEIPTFKLSKLNLEQNTLITTIKALDTGFSGSELKRLFKDGGIKVDQEKETNPTREINEDEIVIQIGKKLWFKVIK